MKFTHGSSKNIDQNDFNVFDYIIDNNGNCSLDCIDNGNDGEGIGIYAFIGDDKDAIKNASCYTGDESAFVYTLDVNIEESDLLNYRDADEIPIEELAEAIDIFISNFRIEKKYNKNVFDSVVNSFENDFDGLKINTVNSELFKQGFDLELDEWAEPCEFDDFHAWIEQVNEQFDMNDPCFKIKEEGGSEAVAEYAIDQSTNLWETIKNIGHVIAVHHTQDGTERYNKMYQQAILNTLPEYNIAVSYVDSDNFAVIFDTDAITLDQKIDLTDEEDKKKKPKRKRAGSRP
jgi:hypothetical protein